MKIAELRPGLKFGLWITISPIENGKQYWYCSCACGKKTAVNSRNLAQGLTRKCRSCASRIILNPVRRRLELSLEVFGKLRGAAKNAIRRCTVENYPQWDDYGGRGIEVYAPWIEDPGEFIAYLSMLPGHDDFTLELDRIDNDGNYEPGNLRFVTRSESMKNRRPSKRGKR